MTATETVARQRVRLGEERDVERVEAIVNWAYRGLLPPSGTCSLSGPTANEEEGEAAKGQWTTEAHLLSGPRVTQDELRRLLRLDPLGKAAVFVVEEARHEGDEEKAGNGKEKEMKREEETGDGEGWEVVGCVLVEKEEDGGHLGMFGVHPHRQGRGLGRLLLSAGEAHVMNVFGCKAVVLHVLAQRTDLLEFYQRRGYTLLPLDAHPFLGLPPHLGESLVAPDQEPLHFRILTKTRK